MKKLIDLMVTAVLAIIGFQIAWAVMTPYLPWLGMTLTLVVIGLVLFGVVVLVRRFFNRGGGDDPLFRG